MNRFTIVLIFNIIETFFCFQIIAQDYNIQQYTSINNINLTSINQIVIDKDENIWFGTNSGLLRYDGQKIVNISKKLKHQRIKFMFHDNILNIIHLVDGQHNYYTIDTKKIILNQHKQISPQINLDQTTNRFQNKLQPKTSHAISKDFNTLIEYYYIDTLLIAAKTISITHLKSTINLYHQLNEPLTLDILNNGIFLQGGKNLFFLYRDNIYSLKLENEKITIATKNKILNAENLDFKPVSSIYNKTNKSFYLGSLVNGFYEVRPQTFNVLKPTDDYINAHNESKSTVYYSQSEDYKGNIFVNNNLIFSTNGHTYFNKNILDYKTALNYTDSKNNIWVADKKSLLLHEKDEKTPKSLFLENITTPLIGVSEINDTCNLFISGNEIVILKKNGQSKTIKKETIGIAENEPFSFVYNHKQSSENKIYILTHKYIYSFDISAKRLHPIRNLDQADYRIMQPINEMYHFIGTYGQGYLIFDGQKWTPMPLDKNGYLKFAHAALCDSNGHVWISSNNGLFRTRLQDMIDFCTGKSKDVFYYYYDKTSGFLTNEFNGGCQSPAIQLKDGRFSFSSMDGLVQFDPMKVLASFPMHKPQIIGIWLNGQNQDSVPASLIITQDIKDIKLEVSTTFYGHTDNLEVQYKIQGYVDQWTDLTDKRYITLQNARYGDFNIEIRYRNGFGNNAFTSFNYPVSILQYFYETWWFKLISIGLGLLGIYFLVKGYSRYTLKKNIELEALIQERNKEVLHTNEVLLEQIKQNDLFQSIFVHDIKSPIRFISSNTTLLKTHWHTLDNQIKQDQISHIHDSVTKIDHFIEETLLWIKIRNKKLKLDSQTFQVLPLIQECIDFHQESDKILKGKIKVVANASQNLFFNHDERLIATIIRNLLSNSIKYTSKGIITVYALPNSNGTFRIGCKDEGKGMPKALVKKLLSDQYRGNDIREDSFKMGYVIIKEIVKLIDGKLLIESQENHGTNVWIEIIKYHS
jgi:signal transduction histidine kinase